MPDLIVVFVSGLDEEKLAGGQTECQSENWLSRS
jgi:hypothetical protein